MDSFGAFKFLLIRRLRRTMYLAARHRSYLQNAFQLVVWSQLPSSKVKELSSASIEKIRKVHQQTNVSEVESIRTAHAPGQILHGTLLAVGKQQTRKYLEGLGEHSSILAKE